MNFLMMTLLCMGWAYAGQDWDEKAIKSKEMIDQGRRLVKITGCNDCHTPMYPQKEGDVPEAEWLTGSSVGFRGPWGTTFPSNLRLMVTSFRPGAFLKYVRNKKYLPPMPGFMFKDLTDRELVSMYAFIKHLGPAGKAAPIYVSPDKNPKDAYIYFVPVTHK